MTGAQPHYGTIIDLLPRAPGPAVHAKATHVDQDGLRVIQFAIPGGSGLPPYEAHGTILLHCLGGRVSVTAMGQTRELHSGQLLHLAVREAFFIDAHEDASVLAIIVIPPDDPDAPLVGR